MVKSKGDGNSYVFPASSFQYQEMTLAISLKKLANEYGSNNDNNGVDLGSASTPTDKDITRRNKHFDFPFSLYFYLWNCIPYSSLIKSQIEAGV